MFKTLEIFTAALHAIKNVTYQNQAKNKSYERWVLIELEKLEHELSIR